MGRCKQSVAVPTQPNAESITTTAAALERAALQASTPEQLACAFDAIMGAPPHQKVLREALGLDSAHLAGIFYSQSAFSFESSLTATEFSVTAGFQALISMKPKGPEECMLSIQMLRAHTEAIRALKQAETSTTTELSELYFNRAIKLMRVSALQAETLARLKGKISLQKIVIEHVDVANGGQAIVGVTGGGGGA
jgi:hypothetical protein